MFVPNSSKDEIARENTINNDAIYPSLSAGGASTVGTGRGVWQRRGVVHCTGASLPLLGLPLLRLGGVSIDMNQMSV